LLQFVEIIFYLFRIQLCGKALEVKRHSGHMPAVVIKSAGAFALKWRCCAQSAQAMTESL
jgi:hypothetical protein